MALDDIKKTIVITKLGLYELTIMPFGVKNSTNTFSQTMAKVFKNWNSQFLKVFVHAVKIHNMNWIDHL
jgi:hypothetical protein